MARNDTAGLLNMVDELLRDSGEPIYYKDLYAVLTVSGLWAGWGQKPDQILYTAIHNECKFKGKQSRFIFLGSGIFVTSCIPGVEFVEAPVIVNNAKPKDPYYRSGDMPADTELRRVQAEADKANQLCYNCASLSFEGPNMHTHELGSCGRRAESGRNIAFATTKACPLWRQRTVPQKQNDRLDPGDLIATALHIQITGNRPKTDRWR